MLTNSCSVIRQKTLYVTCRARQIQKRKKVYLRSWLANLLKKIYVRTGRILRFYYIRANRSTSIMCMFRVIVLMSAFRINVLKIYSDMSVINVM